MNTFGGKCDMMKAKLVFFPSLFCFSQLLELLGAADAPPQKNKNKKKSLVAPFISKCLGELNNLFVFVISNVKTQ